MISVFLVVFLFSRPFPVPGLPDEGRYAELKSRVAGNGVTFSTNGGEIRSNSMSAGGGCRELHILADLQDVDQESLSMNSINE